MKSLKSLYKIGHGPSSSHTIGPERIAKDMKNLHPADSYKVILYGSLSLTGRGHLTDKAIERVLNPVEIIFSNDWVMEHPNTLDIIAFKDNHEIARERYYSVGGGSFLRKGDSIIEEKEVFPHNSFLEIADYCKKEKLTLFEYVYRFEGEEIKNHLKKIWRVMQEAINIGLHTEGFLPGKLQVKRKARSLLYSTKNKVSIELRLISAYAYAVSEVNASGGLVVTSPTCGASGVLPSVLYYLKDVYKYNDDKIIDALATAGIIGNIIKTNGSISGAEAGCQAEIGSACAMAAAAYSELEYGNIDDIEYAAEIALEHHLGLTCDPINGYVQIPCIERNAVAAHRAINAGELAQLLTTTSLISFDTIVETMKETGKDLSERYRETSLGGLAKKYRPKP